MAKPKDVKGLFEGVLNGAVTGKETKFETQSRRVWLQNFAAVSATGAVMWACGKKSSSSSDATPGCQQAQLSTTDMSSEATSLNAALSLENEAINVYTAAAGLPIWTANVNALAPTFLAVAKAFLAQHQAHASKLSAAITAVGGTPVAANSATTDLGHYPGITGVTGITGLSAVLAAAAERELNAAKAYFSLVAALKAQSDVSIVADIAPDEAAHYGVLVAAVLVLGQAESKLLSATNIVPSAFTDDTAFVVPTGFSIRTA